MEDGHQYVTFPVHKSPRNRTRAIALSYKQTAAGDTEFEHQFTIAHSNIGWLKVSFDDYEGALESLDSIMTFF